MKPVEQLSEIVLKLAKMNTSVSDIKKLCLKAKAIKALTDWLHEEREAQATLRVARIG